MNIQDFISRVKTEKNEDSTYSYGGKKDFITPEGDVKTIGGMVKSPVNRVYPKNKQNNSY